MRRRLTVCLLFCLPLAAQTIPTATELSGDPFSIKKTWYIGGTGNWDSLTVDTAAQRLFITHGSVVQVVDLETGSLVAGIPGFREAHSIALDDSGEFAYVSDAPAQSVMAVDRQRLVVDAAIPVACAPRSIAFEPVNKLVFAICGIPAAGQSGPPAFSRQRARAVQPGDAREQSLAGISQIAVIDAGSRRLLAEIAMAGDFRFAVPDGKGQIYVSVGQATHSYFRNGVIARENLPPRIAVLDATEIAAEARSHATKQEPLADDPIWMDWSTGRIPNSAVRYLAQGMTCVNPQGLAIDPKHLRLFAACDGERLEVFDTGHGDQIASFKTGPGNEMVGYDPERGLIFAANGGGYGGLTIVRYDANAESYAVIQNLPTRERARTLAVDSSTGEVYLVTDFQGVDLTKSGGIGTLKAAPIAGSFQVLVVGH